MWDTMYLFYQIHPMPSRVNIPHQSIYNTKLFVSQYSTFLLNTVPISEQCEHGKVGTVFMNYAITISMSSIKFESYHYEYFWFITDGVSVWAMVYFKFVRQLHKKGCQIHLIKSYKSLNYNLFLNNISWILSNIIFLMKWTKELRFSSSDYYILTHVWVQRLELSFCS